MSTRYKTSTYNHPYLPGLRTTGENVNVTVFARKPITWKQRGLKVGPWFIPLGGWKNA